MTDIKRTVVIEMTDALYQELRRAAESGDLTFAELLIGHACTTELNELALAGNLSAWRALLRAWREQDPEHAPDVQVERLFQES